MIHHHDNGSQYLSFAFIQRLIEAGVDASGRQRRRRPVKDDG
jgi:transposase InsO family protein